MGKSKFTKDNSVTFKLVHRSQQDPLVADETAPQNVLLPVASGSSHFKSKKSKKERIEEQVRFGVYFDDDYDYLQHLKASRNAEESNQEMEWQIKSDHEKSKKKNKEPRIMLPSSVFESSFQEKDGMLNRAAALPIGPQPNWDPDIVAALDDDFDFEDPQNQLEDDFFAKMMDGDGNLQAEDQGDEDNDLSDDEDDYEDDDDDDDDDTITSGHSERQFGKEETKSCFSNYSMTSSVMRRNQGLTFLDDQFEAFYEKEYSDETEIGALNEGDVEGHINVNKCDLIKNIIQEKKKEKEEQVYVNERILERFEYDVDEDGDEKLIKIEIDESGKHKKDDEFDCQSIISTYSNLYNHPKIIFEERRTKKDGDKDQKMKIDPRTGIAILPRAGLTARNLKELDQNFSQAGEAKSIRTVQSRLSELSFRDKNETLEEKKARKGEVKELRRERRIERKANQICFKEEKKRQVKEVVNLKQNLNSVKLC